VWRGSKSTDRPEEERERITPQLNIGDESGYRGGATPDEGEKAWRQCFIGYG